MSTKHVSHSSPASNSQVRALLLDKKLKRVGMKVRRSLPLGSHDQSYFLYKHYTRADGPSRTCLQLGLKWSWMHRIHPCTHQVWLVDLDIHQDHLHGWLPSSHGCHHLLLWYRLDRMGPMNSCTPGLIVHRHEPNSSGDEQGKRMLVIQNLTKYERKSSPRDCLNNKIINTLWKRLGSKIKIDIIFSN